MVKKLPNRERAKKKEVICLICVHAQRVAEQYYLKQDCVIEFSDLVRDPISHQGRLMYGANEGVSQKSF